jgi:prepilin-type N-terminal cleavage/methylation domain-containing protein
VKEEEAAVNKLMGYLKRSQRGFTLIEMAVVIAIIGVLAAVATPLLVNHLAAAKERAYEADLGIVQTAVDAAYSAPNNARFLGKNQYTILGKGETDRTGHTVRCKVSATGCFATLGSFAHPDDGTPLTNTERDSAAGVDNRDWNPLGGIQGANLLLAGATTKSIAWTDDGDAVREILAATVSGSLVTLSPDTWTTIEVTRENTVYYVDPRYYFVDMAKLVTDGFLKEVPKSSSLDNSATGTGSYIYYVDDKGKVQTFPKDFPRTNGFVAGVYP